MSEMKNAPWVSETLGATQIGEMSKDIVPQAFSVVKMLEGQEMKFLEDFPDKQLVLQTLVLLAPDEFWNYFYDYALDAVDDYGWGNGIRCPECGSNLDGGLCDCMKKQAKKRGYLYLQDFEEPDEHMIMKSKIVKEEMQ